MNDGLLLPPDLAAAVNQGQQPMVQIAAPMNDVQLIAWIAAQIMGDRHRQAGQCVDDAMNIVAEALTQFQAGKLQHAVERARLRVQS